MAEELGRSELVGHDGPRLGRREREALGVRDLEGERGVHAGVGSGLDPERAHPVVGLGVADLRVIGVHDLVGTAGDRVGHVDVRTVLGVGTDHLGAVQTTREQVRRPLDDLARRGLVARGRGRRALALGPSRGIRGRLAPGRCLGLGVDLHHGLAAELDGQGVVGVGLRLGEDLGEDRALGDGTRLGEEARLSPCLGLGVTASGVGPGQGVSLDVVRHLGDPDRLEVELLDDLDLAVDLGADVALALGDADDLVPALGIVPVAVAALDEGVALGVGLPVPDLLLVDVQVGGPDAPGVLEGVLLAPHLGLGRAVRLDVRHDLGLGLDVHAVDLGAGHLRGRVRLGEALRGVLDAVVGADHDVDSDAGVLRGASRCGRGGQKTRRERDRGQVGTDPAVDVHCCSPFRREFERVTSLDFSQVGADVALTTYVASTASALNEKAAKNC